MIRQNSSVSDMLSEGNHTSGSLLQKSILFVFTFFFVIGPRITFDNGVSVDTLSLFSVLFCLLILFWTRGFLLTASFMKYLICLIVLVLYSGFITLINGSMDVFSFLRSARALLNFVGAISLVHLYARILRWHFPNFMMGNIYWTLSIHGCIMSFQFMSPEFREFVYAYTSPSIHPNNLSYRMAGLTNGAGAGTSLIQAIPIIMMPIFWRRAEDLLSRIVLLVSFMINVFAIIVSGKTGLYFSIIFFALGLVTYRRFNRGFVYVNTNGTSLLQLIVILMVVTALVVGFVQFFPDTQWRIFVERSFSRTFGLFIGLIEQGRLIAPTARSLLTDHIITPSNPWVIFFGNSNSGRGKLGYIASDIGYVRLWFALGLTGLFLTCSFYLMVLDEAWRKMKYHYALAWLSIVLSLMMLIANLKEIFLLTRYFFSVSSLCLVGLLVVKSASVRTFLQGNRGTEAVPSV